VKASLLAIGDEIVGGITVDTNTPWLADRLRSVGVEPVGAFSAVDEEMAIVRAFTRALEDAEVAVSTGGLGPTADDLTTAAVARLAGQPLVLHEPSLRAIERRFATAGLEMTANNRKQAMFPAGAAPLPNAEGTAPGFVCPVQTPRGARHVIVLPGVPREMRAMADATVLPWLVERGGGRRFASRTFSTFGLTESRLDELLSGLVAPSEARLSFRAAFPRMQTRLTLEGGPGDDLDGRLDVLEQRLRERIGHYLYARGDEGLEETAGRMLRERGLTLAVAESCTGGLIGHRLTEVPGSSAFFKLGLVTYSNDAKRDLLGVDPGTLRRHGAVSTETAEEMAEGGRRAAAADLGVATTGIAGPTGGTDEKPVGTVCVALAWEGGRWSRRYDLGARGRSYVKEMTAMLALDRVRRWISGLPEVERS
jgi:nicotinamide-nucleotide amidase